MERLWELKEMSYEVCLRHLIQYTMLCYSFLVVLKYMCNNGVIDGKRRGEVERAAISRAYLGCLRHIKTRPPPDVIMTYTTGSFKI